MFQGLTLAGGAGAENTFCTGVGTSCASPGASASSCSARYVSDLAGSYSTVGLWLQARAGAGGRGRGRGGS